MIDFYGIEIAEETLMLLASVIIIFFLFEIYLEIRKRRRYFKVRVLHPSGIRTKWKKPEADGKTIVMKKPGRKTAGWSFTFGASSVIPGTRNIDVMYGMEEAVEYDFKGKNVRQPVLTKDQVKEFATWEAMKARYAKLEKYQLPTLFWLLLAISITSVALQIFQLLTSGRI